MPDPRYRVRDSGEGIVLEELASNGHWWPIESFEDVAELQGWVQESEESARGERMALDAFLARTPRAGREI